MRIRLNNLIGSAYFILTFLGCNSQPSYIKSQQFNADAKLFFLDSYESLDLKPLTEESKCILKNTIDNDLDKLNDWSLTIIKDNYTIKNYYEDYLHFNFSFINDRSDNNRFYFISLPHLEDFFWNLPKYYEPKNDTLYEIKAPLDLIKENTALIDKFLESNAFNVVAGDVKGFYTKYQLARHLFGETFKPIFSNEIDVGTFLGRTESLLESGKITHSVFQRINNIITPMFNSANYQVQAFDIKQMCYVLLIYTVDESTSKIKIDLYILPESERRNLTGYDETTEYRDCFSK